jgi:hypothetical protein
MTHHRDIIESYLPERHVDIFAEWAFGPDFREIERKNLTKAWNSLHGDKMILIDEGKPLEDIPKMIKLWISELADEMKNE